jgi:hypothetical protein
LHEGGEKTKEKSKILISLMVFSLLFTSTSVLAEETIKIKFYFINVGSCLVLRGPIDDPLWQGIGDGVLTLSGKADGEYYEQSGTTWKGYMMENLAARGSLLLRWTEDDKSKHWVAVTFYSTATSKGVYYYNHVGSTVVGSISWASNIPGDYIRFKGIYYDGTKIQEISGLALLMLWQISEEEYQVSLNLLSGPQPIQQTNIILAGWSTIDYTTPGFPEIPAAQVFRWNVEIKTP